MELSPNTNPTGEGTKNFSMNGPIPFYDEVAKMACDLYISQKQFFFDRFLKGVEQVDGPHIAEQLKEKLRAHRASAIRATRQGAEAFREVAKEAATVGLCLMAAGYIVFVSFAGSTSVYRTSTAVRPVRRNSKSEEVAC